VRYGIILKYALIIKGLRIMDKKLRQSVFFRARQALNNLILQFILMPSFQFDFQ